MDTILNSVAIVCVTIVVLCVWKVINMVWVRPKKMEKYLRDQGFTGNTYRLLFGDMKESSMMLNTVKSKQITLSSSGDDVQRRVQPFLLHLHKKYGKNFILWLGWRPRVHIMEPELIKEVLMNTNHFLKTQINPLTKYVVTGLVAHDGDKWFQHRRLLNPAFHVDKLKSMLPPAFHTSCSKMIENWETMVMTEGSDSIELDIWSDIQTLTCDVLARTSFGSSYEEGVHIFELLKEQTELVYSTFQTVYIPGMRFLPTKTNKRIKALHNEIQQLLGRVIDTRLKAIKAGKGRSDDLLGTMLDSNVRNGDGNKVGMPIEEIMDECKIFYFAGQAPTSSLLVWTMILLSKHQDWQSRAREEVLNVFNKGSLDFDGLNHLKVVNMILHEVLRLYPPAVALARRIDKDIRVGGRTLPSGTEVGLPIMLLHYDKEIWGDDAKEFNPERFSKGVSKATKSQVTYFPFGWGPRICIGQNFAMLEAKLALAMILKKFSFEVSPSYVHAPHIVFTLQPQYGAPLILRKL